GRARRRPLAGQRAADRARRHIAQLCTQRGRNVLGLGGVRAGGGPGGAVLCGLASTGTGAGDCCGFSDVVSAFPVAAAAVWPPRRRSLKTALSGARPSAYTFSMAEETRRMPSFLSGPTTATAVLLPMRLFVGYW